MTSSVVVFALLGAVFILAVGQTDAINCYVCSGTSACADEPNLSSADVTTSSGCLSCSKLKVGDAVTRACEGSAQSEGCTEIELLSTHSCYCNSDLCNSASHVTVSMVSALLLALVAMVFRF